MSSKFLCCAGLGAVKYGYLFVLENKTKHVRNIPKENVQSDQHCTYPFLHFVNKAAVIFTNAPEKSKIN
jgi:hypothetical protein